MSDEIFGFGRDRLADARDQFAGVVGAEAG